MSPDGRLLAVATDALRLYDREGGLKGTIELPWTPRNVAFSDDGRRLLAVTAGKLAEVVPESMSTPDGQPLAMRPRAVRAWARMGASALSAHLTRLGT